MRILVTGHLGFIGSKVHQTLHDAGHQVTGIDNKLYGINQDIRTFSLRTFPPEIIVHTAALTSVTESMRFPERYNDVNVTGTLNMLRILKMNPSIQFIFLSTAGLYGEGISHTEESPLCPQSMYALSKMVGEAYIKMFAKNWLILRLANVIGEGEKGEPNVYQIFAKEQELTIYGDGLQTRDFVQATTVCSAIEKAIKNNISGIFNIGSGQTKTVLDVAKEFKKPYKFAPAREGEIHNFGVNISKAKEWGLL